MSIHEIDTEPLPIEYTAEGDRTPCATVMTGHGRNKNRLLFVFDGPEGGELVVPFEGVFYDTDKHRLVLTRKITGRTNTEVVAFQAEYWSQWGDVSEWFEANGIPEVPRRFR